MVRMLKTPLCETVALAGYGGSMAQRINVHKEERRI
jgi:hypothetical protein